MGAVGAATLHDEPCLKKSAPFRSLQRHVTPNNPPTPRVSQFSSSVKKEKPSVKQRMKKWRIIVVDESQDMSLLYFEVVCKILADLRVFHEASSPGGFMPKPFPSTSCAFSEDARNGAGPSSAVFGQQSQRALFPASSPGILETTTRTSTKPALKFYDPLAPPRLIIMGDRHQSIYAFNEADERYIVFASELFGCWNPYEWAHLQLSESFRVTHQMAEFVNTCMLGVAVETVDLEDVDLEEREPPAALAEVGTEKASRDHSRRSGAEGAVPSHGEVGRGLERSGEEQEETKVFAVEQKAIVGALHCHTAGQTGGVSGVGGEASVEAAIRATEGRLRGKDVDEEQAGPLRRSHHISLRSSKTGPLPRYVICDAFGGSGEGRPEDKYKKAGPSMLKEVRRTGRACCFACGIVRRSACRNFLCNGNRFLQEL